MSVIVNAVALGKDSDFRDWVRAGTCYHARTVLTGAAGASAKALALDTITSPTTHLDRWIHVLSTDPAICGVGDTVGDGDGQIGQALLLTQIAATWPSLAGVLYPEA
ncbi:MAG TPA: hypothetical protein PKD84_13390 [Propionicimonas sp.]|nr:hypothetical protein [Propionicimonas sp.]